MDKYSMSIYEYEKRRSPVQGDGTVFENLVNRAELARRLSLSQSYVSKLMKDEGLPYLKIGRSVRFKLSEVVEFLERRKRP